LEIQTGKNLGQNSASVVHCAIPAQIAKSQNQIEDTSVFPLRIDNLLLTKSRKRLSQTGVGFKPHLRFELRTE
jgi:hypothetical protein